MDRDTIKNFEDLLKFYKELKDSGLRLDEIEFILNFWYMTNK